jgi:NADH-quinone oxidoreductase subunit F
MKTTAKKIHKIEELNELRLEIQKEQEVFDKEIKEKIMLCVGGGCIASGALNVKSAFDEEIKKRNLGDAVVVKETGCLGPCVCGPVVVMGKDKVFYQNVNPADCADIIDEHIIRGKIIDRLVWKEGNKENPVSNIEDINFFKKQTKVVLRNCGKINPTSIEEYIGVDGYQAVAKVITTMTPEDVIQEMRDSVFVAVVVLASQLG